MKKTLLHIFKPGNHTPMTGGRLSFSEADLAASARAYNPALHEAPIVIGHPVHDAPAYGWVNELQASSKGLYADVDRLDPMFVEQVGKKKRFKKISASFYAPDSPNNPVPGVYYLRHVGFLGAQPPSVKGLDPINLGDSEKGVVYFSEEGDSNEEDQGFFQKMREWLTKNKGQEVADKILSAEKAADLEDDAADAGTTADVDVSADDKAEDLVPELVKQVAEQAEELKELREELDALDEGEGTRADAAEFAERLIQSGRLRPRYRGTVVAFMEFAAGRGRTKRNGNGALEFSEGGTRRALLPAFKAFLNSLPRSTDFGEAATRNRAAAAKAQVNPLVADAERRAARK